MYCVYIHRIQYILCIYTRIQYILCICMCCMYTPRGCQQTSPYPSLVNTRNRPPHIHPDRRAPGLPLWSVRAQRGWEWSVVPLAGPAPGLHDTVLFHINKQPPLSIIKTLFSFVSSWTEVSLRKCHRNVKLKRLFLFNGDLTYRHYPYVPYYHYPLPMTYPITPVVRPQVGRVYQSNMESSGHVSTLNVSLKPGHWFPPHTFRSVIISISKYNFCVKRNNKKSDYILFISNDSCSGAGHPAGALFHCWIHEEGIAAADSLDHRHLIRCLWPGLRGVLRTSFMCVTLAVLHVINVFPSLFCGKLYYYILYHFSFLPPLVLVIKY